MFFHPAASGRERKGLNGPLHFLRRIGLCHRSHEIGILQQGGNFFLITANEVEAIDHIAYRAGKIALPHIEIKGVAMPHQENILGGNNVFLPGQHGFPHLIDVLQNIRHRLRIGKKIIGSGAGATAAGAQGELSGLCHFGHRFYRAAPVGNQISTSVGLCHQFAQACF